MTRSEGLFAISAGLFAILAKVLEYVAFPVSNRPDLLMVLAISVGWESGFWAAAPVGFVIGLFEDLIVGRALGSRAISLCVAAIATSLLKKLVNPDSVVSKALIAVISSVLADMCAYAALRSMDYEIGFMYSVRAILPATALWSAAFIVPVHAIVSRCASALGRFWPSNADRGRGAAI